MNKKQENKEVKSRPVNFVTFEQGSFSNYKQEDVRQSTNTTSIKKFVKEFIKM